MHRNPDVNELIRLAPSFAHSVRDDVTFFRGVLQSVADDGSVSVDVQRKLEEINGRLGGVAQTARQFIQITDTDYRVAINARECILGLEPLLRRILGSHKLEMDIADDLWLLWADGEMQFAQILLYLVTNSSNAMRDIGTVLVRARNVTQGRNPDDKGSAADYVSIEVIDSGVGIPKEIVGRIFEPFVSVNGKPGSVSLASTEFIVRRLGGRICVESEVGVGTTFNVFLPRCTHDPKTQHG